MALLAACNVPVENLQAEPAAPDYYHPGQSAVLRLGPAILAQFGMTCPLCSGSGVVPRGIHDHYKPVIAERNSRPCKAPTFSCVRCARSVDIRCETTRTLSSLSMRVQVFSTR